MKSIQTTTIPALTLALALAALPVGAQQATSKVAAAGKAAVPVTVKNFQRAESDLYFGRTVKLGGFGKFYHYRTMTPIEEQSVVRMNRDALYSGGVFDLDAGPVTITLPNTGKRFVSMLVRKDGEGGDRRVKRDGQGWDADFPMREEVEDYAGKTRAFVITCHEAGLGFTVRAVEEGRSEAGYEFAAYSETSPYSSPYSALGRLRQKMYRGSATRHITGAPGEYRMLHDRLSGRITSAGEGGVVLVVDGVPLDIDDLASILVSHEGWSFELGIVDALE